MKIAANQHLARGSDKRHVIGRDSPVNIDNTFRQYKPNELGENAGVGLRHWKSQEPNVRISQQGFDSCRIRRADNPHGIYLVFAQCLDRG